jgi:hypothetical protein
VELPSAATARATRRQGDVTRSSSPILLAGASVVEARRLGGTCVELDRAGQDDNSGAMVGQGGVAMTMQNVGGGSGGSTQRSRAHASRDEASDARF